MTKQELKIQELIVSALEIYEETGFTDCFKEKNGQMVVDIDSFKREFDISSKKRYKPELPALPKSIFVDLDKKYKELIEELNVYNHELRFNMCENEDSENGEGLYSSIVINTILDFDDNIQAFLMNIVNQYEASSVSEVIEMECGKKYKELDSFKDIVKYNKFISYLHDISVYVEDEDGDGHYVTNKDLYEKYDFIKIIDLIEFSKNYVFEILEIITGVDSDDAMFEHDELVRKAIEKTVEYIVKNNI